MVDQLPKPALNNQPSSIDPKIKRKKWGVVFILAGLVLGLGVIVGLFLIIPKKPIKTPITQTQPLPKPEYKEVYTLINDKISQSAPIAINLPPNVTPAEAKTKITITPAVKGAWLDSKSDNQILYQPQEKLKIGKHYSIALASGEGTISKDFLVDEDPKIISIFPKNDSEANENSNITIIFNRPMVPLSSLDFLEQQEIPVSIIPATAGRFKWIGTRTLQFIPENTLITSSNYLVKINNNFKSIDGLPVVGQDYKFITRPLRYEYLSSQETIYNEPIYIRFNQPVDLDRTKAEIKLQNTTTQKPAEFIAGYGTKEKYNEETKKSDKIEDNTVIAVYNHQDKFDRAKFWDFENSYNLKIAKAYPKNGDIILDQARETNIQVTNIVKNLSAISDRTNFAAPDFFDPQGKLVIEFYEEINLDTSKITADRLVKIEYGEKCLGADNVDSYYYENSGIDCEKVPDQKKILLTFDSQNIKKGDILNVILEKIKNLSGLPINATPLTYPIATIPHLKITRTTPAAGSRFSTLTELILCTNSPLAVPAKNDLKDSIKSNLDYQFNSWQRPYRVPKEGINYNNYDCQPGEFVTLIYYGIMPDSDYQFNINGLDDFGDNASLDLSFHSGSMSGQYLNFYHFQNKYNVTTPAKTQLTYAVQNMEYVDLQICQLKPEKLLYYLEKQPDYTASPSQLADCRLITEKRIDLPKKFWIKNYFNINLKDYLPDLSGHYLLSFSNPNYRTDWEWKMIYERTFVTITNLSVVEKQVELWNMEPNEYSLTPDQKGKLNNLYWVTNIASMEPILNAKVKLFSGQYSGKTDTLTLTDEGTYTTDSQGLVSTPIVNRLYGAVISSGADSAIISNNTTQLQGGGSAMNALKVYTYTDRPIYRPGNEVGFKGIYRIGFDGSYEIPVGKKIPVKIYNSRNDEIYNKDLELNNFGTFNDKIILDALAPLGQYRIEANDNYSYFSVEEYVPAAFKVEATANQEEFISGDTATLNIVASYYFGAPLEGGEVEYSIGSQDYYFDRFQDGYFNFGFDWYMCWYGCSFNDKFILRNKAILDSSGHAQIIQPLDLKRIFKNADERKSKIFVFYITVRNSNGQSVSTQKSFVVHGGEYYLGLNTNKSFLGVDEKFTAKLKTVNTQGQELGVSNINLAINKIKYVYSKRKEVDGAFYYHWEKSLELVTQKTVDTTSSGDWQDDFSLNQEGEYELTAKSTDSRGNEISTTYGLYVYGSGQVEVMPTNDQNLEVITDKNNLEVGDQANIIIKSPYAKAKALVAIERGKIFDYKIIDVNQGLIKYNFEIKDSYIPNVYASVVLLSPKPEVKFGKVEFKINTTRRQLNIAVVPDKKIYLPGEEVKLHITAKDFQGQGAESELSIAVVDMSVLALKGNPKNNPLIFFYGGWPLTVSTDSNIKNILYEVAVPSATKGGGGAEAEDLARKKRGVFKDTALWQAVITTDKNGQADLAFTLPDNLTTWQIESLGVTQDTKLGVDYQEFTSRKELMVVPLKPRFTVPGDEFAIGAKIFNQTGKKQSVDVSLSTVSLEPLNKGVQKLQLEAGATATVYFKVKAPIAKQTGSHGFILSAKNDQYEDTVEQQIKINKNTTYEATATAGSSNKLTEKEYVFLPGNVVKDQGGLTVNTSATLAVFISDALNYLLSYPYGCSEQIASKLDAIAIVKIGLNLDNIGDKFNLKNIQYNGAEYTLDELVSLGLGKIYENQRFDGGFSYYPYYSDSYIYLTVHIVQTLKHLKEAGYAIDEDVMKKAFAYLNNAANYKYNFISDNDAAIAVAQALSQLKEYGPMNQVITNKIFAILADKQIINEKLSQMSLVNLATLLSQNVNTFGLANKNNIYNILENKLEIDSRGSFIPTGKKFLWEYYETPVKDTALFLNAMVLDGRPSEVTDRVLRWLLSSRDKDGAWGSTNNTISVVEAMTNYLAWKKENQSDFQLDLGVNSQTVKSYDFNPKTILDQYSWSTPLSGLANDKLNSITFTKTNRNELTNNFYYDLSLKYFLPVQNIAPRDEGFTITRNFYRLEDKKNTQPVASVKVGEVLRGHLEIILPKARNFVMVEDFIPAGTELVNFNLSTEDQSLLLDQENKNRVYDYDYWWNDWYNDGQFRPEVTENRDDRLFIFRQRLEPGTYTYDYYVRALVPGTFIHLPAVASEMYFPENFGRTNGGYFSVTE